MDKRFYVNVVNLTVGKMYSLPTLYTDRTEACIRGQNYIRNRQRENRDDVFYRVLIAENGNIAKPTYFTTEYENDDCPVGQENCFDYPNFSEWWEKGEEDEEEMPTCGNPACKQKPFELSDLYLEDLLHLVAMKAAQEDSEVSDDPEELN
jgi:hypothetical protein